MRQILDPGVARLKFESEVRAIGGGLHPIPQNTRMSWRVTKASYPQFVAELIGESVPAIRVVADCTNYDYDPPLVHFRTARGVPIPWRNLQLLGRVYSHPKGLFHDVTMYPNGVGFICREGHFGYHVAHQEPMWLDIRATAKGRLFAIIENTLDALNLQALIGV